MRLIGRHASPYVRRVAVTLHHYGLDYAHEPVMPFGPGKSAVAAHNPLARVPVLVLDDGEPLIDSAAILDHLDQCAGQAQSLTPAAGPARRDVLNTLAICAGTMEKLVAVLYERHFRPRETWHRPWIEACEDQVRDGFAWLEARLESDWLCDARMTQANLTLAVFWAFGRAKRPGFFARLDCPRIAALTDRLEATASFHATTPEVETLTSNLARYS